MTEIDHPSHYGGDTTYETIKVLQAWLTPQEFAGFLKGNAVKYQSRHREKGKQADLEKALWYSERLATFVGEVGHDAIYLPSTLNKETVEACRDVLLMLQGVAPVNDMVDRGVEKALHLLGGKK